MLAFTDEQLVTIQSIASPLPLGLRGAFLEALAASWAIAMLAMVNCIVVRSRQGDWLPAPER